MKRFLLLTLFISVYACSYAQEKTTLTDSLTNQFNKAWNSDDIEKMISLLQPDAFFESPYQLRYGRDTMETTVLKTNPPVFKNVKTTELYSHVEKHLAWSLGKLTGNIYDDDGKKTGKILRASYTYLFTKKDSEDWKLQMMIFYEK